VFAFDAVILAGGRSSRLGGAPKARLRQGAERLLDRAAAATHGAAAVVVVAPRTTAVPAGAVLTREDPPFSGPLAGLAAGLAAPARTSDWVLLLACDIPGAASAVAALLARAAQLAETGGLADADALLARPAGDRPQPLMALYRVAALQQEFAHRAPADRSMWSVLDRLAWHPVPAPAGSGADVDTPEDAAALGWRIEHEEQ
jgi:molybdopterin-guanine dinucleotide biosynthesis protein A